MRARNLDVQIADARHPDEDVRARQESGKGRGERDRAARGETHRRADHHLLGNEVLEEPVAVLLLELLAESRVLDIAIERDDAIVGVADSGERRPVRLARRYAAADYVRRR